MNGVVPPFHRTSSSHGTSPSTISLYVNEYMDVGGGGILTLLYPILKSARPGQKVLDVLEVMSSLLTFMAMLLLNSIMRPVTVSFQRLSSHML